MKFIIEQIALCPPDPAKAIEFLELIGLGEWAHDHVVADGSVFGSDQQRNEADLAFNYEATSSKALELEVLHYTNGMNWMQTRPSSVSHLGMHCTAGELLQWRAKFADLGILVAQEVNTASHTNPVIAGKRLYTYVIFSTRHILGTDLKFIVRHVLDGQP
jgi:hypothetical protein